MTWSPDAQAEREPGAWTIVAAGVLGLQGLSMAVYAGILRPVGVALDVPILGRADVVYLAFGILAIVAAAGVGRRRPWGRVLGMSVAVASGLLMFWTASSPAFGIVALALPAFVVYALWRQWPRPRAAVVAADGADAEPGSGPS